MTLPAACSGFGCLESISRKRLIDSLCSNLSVLGVSVNSLAALEDEEERAVSATSHSSALKAYTFLLWWICSQAEQEAREALASGAPAAGGGGRWSFWDLYAGHCTLHGRGERDKTYREACMG